MTSPRRALAGFAALGLLAPVIAVVAPAAAAPTTFTSTTNPILSDGSYYSADPAPLVVPAGAAGNETGADQLYLYTGHDEAGPTHNDFLMNEWGALVTSDVDAGEWTHHPSLMRPEEAFDWATPGRAYAGQVVRGPDDRYYWYVPVHEAESTASDRFGIGVAVSDSPTGPWTDLVGGPIISQSLPTANTIHNIDPTILIDGEGEDTRVYIYWGSFSNLRMLELESDMHTPASSVSTVTGLTGFFEGAWAFERNGTYYMAYAGNNAGPTSQCTPANYHACIAYGTAPSPQGPWTYRGTVLAPVSSTTSHPGIVEFDGEWWIAYHNADAEGGNHFRRSVAIDRVEWDDTQTPARMTLVEQTPLRGPDTTPRRNIAHAANVTVSNDPVPTQYWTRSLNDELVRPNPLPPDMWGTWTANNPAQQWVQYSWDQPMRVSGSSIDFWSDQPAGSGVGVAPPESWYLEYFADGSWHEVPNPSGYPTSTSGFQDTTFDAVTTTQVRATFNASTNGSTHAGLAVEEWMVLAEPAQSVRAPSPIVEIGETALPGTASVTYPGDLTLEVPVLWDEVSADDVASAGTFEVAGTLLGHAADRITATVTVIDPTDTEGDETAPTLTLTPLGSQGSNGWFRSEVRVRVDAEDDRGGRMTIAAALDDADPVVVDETRSTVVTVSEDGSHAVTATATDRAGNTSEAVALEVSIDATAPHSTAELSERTVTITATDETSGLDRIEARLDQGEWFTVSEPVAAPDADQYQVAYRAIDRAGNVESARTLTIPADISGPLAGNIAPLASIEASYTAPWNATSVLNDGQVPATPSQGQLWGTWSGTNPESQWVAYTWQRPVRLTGAAIQFWNDSAPTSGVGVAVPRSWVLEHWDGSEWVEVSGVSAYGTSTSTLNEVTFDPVITSRLRAVLQAGTDGTTYSAVAASEFRVMADDPGAAEEPSLTLEASATARCVAGNATLALRAVNGEDVPLAIALESALGERTVTDVQPGKAATGLFAARAPSLDAGSARVTGTGEVDGVAVTTTIEVPFEARACR